MSAARVGRVMAAILGTAAASYMLARSSAAPLAAQRADTALLRLSWSARPERIEVCRSLSLAELEEREEHMRQRVECDGRFATYALVVESDGQVVHESVVRGAGLRHDRPIYLLREIDLTPAVHRVRVRFTRRERTDDDSTAFADDTPAASDTGLFAGRAQREVVERARRARAAIPAHLELDTTLTFQPDRVIVISFDSERRSFRVLAESER